MRTFLGLLKSTGKSKYATSDDGKKNIDSAIWVQE